MGITTKSGDKGFTYIKDKSLAKDDIIFDLLGTIDETIAWLVLCYNLTNEVVFKNIVDQLSVIAGLVAGYGNIDLHESIKLMEDKTLSFHHINIFTYPYNDYNKSIINLTRSVVRRLERLFWKYKQINEIDDNIGVYLNRLSDFLYTFI